MLDSFTSQRCNDCGHVQAENRPERDRFGCVACRHVADPDVNAARNIRDYALGLWGDPAKVEVVASLPLLLTQQAKATRRFKRRDQTAEGPSASACGDLCEGMSSRTNRVRRGKQETTRSDSGKMAA